MCLMNAVTFNMGPRKPGARQLGATAAPMHAGLILLACGVLLYSALRGQAGAEPAGEAPFAAAARLIDSASETLRPVAATLNAADLALAHYISRRYRIASEASESLVSLANSTGREISLDPQLILAVIAIESRFNPIAESEMGAKGLMQVIPKLHADKFGDGGIEHSLFPASNMLAGARVLKDCIRRSGSVETGLQWYNGAPWDEGNHYAQRILTERTRFQLAMQGKLPPPANPAAKPVTGVANAANVPANPSANDTIAIDVARLELPPVEDQ
jgi:hypothetical protein